MGAEASAAAGPFTWEADRTITSRKKARKGRRTTSEHRMRSTEGRCDGEGANSCDRSVLSPLEYDRDTGAYEPRYIFWARPWIEDASNAWCSVHISYRMQPSAQTSDLWS